MKKSKCELQIIEEIKKGINVSENFKLISEKHSGIFFQTASKYISRSRKEKRIDFFKEKDYWIHHCIMNYCPNKGTKFSTFLSNMIKWICLNSYNEYKKKILINYTDDYQSNDYIENPTTSTFTEEHKSDFVNILDYIKNIEDQRVYEIFKMRYLDGKKNSVMPWKDVCKNKKINLSVQGCINLHNKYINKLKKTYKK